MYVCLCMYMHVYELINPFIRITYARDITLSGSRTFQTSKITEYILTTHTHVYVHTYIHTHLVHILYAYTTLRIQWEIYTN